MANTKRTVRKTVETRVTFTNDDIKALLLKAAMAPEEAENSATLKTESDDTFYGDIIVVWWASEKQEFDE